MAEKFRLQFRRLADNRDGNFAVLGAIAFVPIIGAAALATDLVGAYLEAERIQSALDSAALGSVRAYGEGATEDEAQKEAEKFFWSNYSLPQNNLAEALAAPAEIDTATALAVAFTRDVNEDTAAAEFSFEYKPLFLERASLQIRRQAVAARAAGAEACILALDHTADRAFDVSG
ncbi:MAG TPA: pilus assembly protein TadG-related protein, partial [Sinorhizobium sp.]|nr:pilus assembly protein TadG-related protein [Sinorhizobium sp.]